MRGIRPRRVLRVAQMRHDRFKRDDLACQRKRDMPVFLVERSDTLDIRDAFGKILPRLFLWAGTAYGAESDGHVRFSSPVAEAARHIARFDFIGA